MHPTIQPSIQPALRSSSQMQFQLDGIIHQRLRACLDQWWLIAPDANPALLQMFRDRDRQPARDLLPWSGEFVGKFITSGVLGWRLTRDPRLFAVLRRTVDELVAVQDADGYLGPFARDQRLTGKLCAMRGNASARCGICGVITTACWGCSCGIKR